MEGVSENMIVGSSTEVIAGEKMIVTAGAIDAHIHYICPQQVNEAISSGTTTFIGGGTGPSAGTNATTCTPSPFYLKHMMLATDGLPMNFAFTGKGNDAGPAALEEIVKAGAAGLKLHEVSLYAITGNYHNHFMIRIGGRRLRQSLTPLMSVISMTFRSTFIPTH